MFTIGELAVLTEEDRLGTAHNCGICDVARVCILRLYTELRQRSGLSPRPDSCDSLSLFTL